MENLFNPKLIALKLALKKMFAGNHFSICTINECIKLTGVIPNSETLKIMHAVHCVNFTDMDDNFRKWIFSETIKMFTIPGFDFNKIEVLNSNSIILFISNK